MNITEFQLNPRIEHDHGIMALEIWLLGPLGQYERKLLLPITWQDISDDGDVKPEVMQLVEMIVARLNAPQQVTRRIYREEDMMVNDCGIEFP